MDPGKFSPRNPIDLPSNHNLDRDGTGSLSQRNIEHSRAGVDTSRQKIHGRKLSYGKSDERRNLYILGLPFSLTRTEFVALFSEHGIVSHAVILATVDNASRRRGFVVMSSHTEAKAALDALDGQQVKQHTLDVSWAVVQRSQGFLDGADRIVMLESPTPSSPSDESFSAPSENCNASPAVSNSNQPEQNGCTRTLVVSNLPISLFSHDSDLHPLFCPFGHVKSLKFSTLPALDWHSRPDTVLAVVEYANQTSAHEALTALNGQTYANYTIKVEYPPNAKSARFASTPPKLEPGSKYIPQGVSSSYFMLSPMFAPMSVNSEPFLVDTPTPNACVFPMINNINRTSLYALPITSYYSLGHGSGIHSAYAPQSYPQIPYFVPNASPITPAQGGFPGQSSASL